MLEGVFVDSAAKFSPMCTKKSLNDSAMSLFTINKDIMNKSTVVLFPLLVSEFIVFQPVLGSVALHSHVIRINFCGDSSLISLCSSQYLPYFWYIDKVSIGFVSHI